ncbi:hemolymph lipopolysaccharide-binding protein [Spodoptera frugiperda]|uniref:Hemolymph lipopolysaccharide-binding protein n=1 Tax=Spodoptera frugiperda TaxID=7108 RepID=A0A9R0CZZ8_SPOFR|nr:hemolymph lipopolysaccharide-binding protein [Spodoptera frugiperda]
MNKYIFLMLLPVVLGLNDEMPEHVPRYTFHRYPATFDEASYICKQEGGNLAVVTSKEVENEMLALWARSGPVVNPSHGLNAQAFIGLQLTSYGWKTIYGRYPPYVNWSSTWWGRQQPDSPAYQKCGSLLKEGGMDDVHCYYKLAFFCEN